MKIFKVTIEIQTVVEAESATDAEHKVSMSHVVDWSDESQHLVATAQQVSSLSELPNNCGWDGECLPWGGDGKTRLKEVLK